MEEISWHNNINLYTYDEGTSIDVSFFYNDYKTTDTEVVFESSILSNSLPKDIVVSNNFSNNNFTIKGKLPIINKTVSYFVVFRLKLTKNNEIIGINDRCVEIKSVNKEIKWNESFLGNETIYWNETFDSIICNIIEYSNVNINLMELLSNIDGNEVIKKIYGTIPNGLILTNNGILLGSFMEKSGNKNTYETKIRVFRNDEPIESLTEKKLIFEIYPPELESEPQWATPSGKIGSLKFGEESHMYISAYDPNEQFEIKYRIIGGVLPNGLTLNEETGKIEGILKSNQIRNWEITFEAYKINVKEYASEKRIFIIETNNINDYNEIQWGEEDIINIGSYKIGDIITSEIPLATTLDGEIIEYNVIGSDLPKGLILNKNGILSGRLEYQECKEYLFDIVAKTTITSKIKTFKITVQKGLGRNSIKMYLRFNNEYKTQINHIRKQLNNRVYDNGSIIFDVNTFPKIDIATLTCYDREILSYMLDFGNPEIVRLGKTKKLQHSQPNNLGNIIGNYDVFYKSIDESTLQWDDIDNGNYDFQQKVNEINLKIDNIEDKELIDFNFEHYDSHKDSIWSYTVPLEEENSEELIIKNYKTDPHVQYNVFNFENVRKILSQKIYVYQKTDGYYYYDMGNHQILGKSLGIDDKTFNPEYNHMEVIDDTNGNLVVKNAEVIDDTDGNLILKDLYEYGENIYNPWCFDRKVNTNIEISKLTPDAEMVMPLINTEDVKIEERYNENGEKEILYYIQFLDEEIEPLPEWKLNETKIWSPTTTYNKDDVIKYNYKYYRCKQDFTSQEYFEEDTNLYELLTDTTLKQHLEKRYFPTLDIGYYEVDSNTYNLKELNKLENNGDFLTNYDFVFYEVTCEHLYKENIENNGELEENNYNIFKQEEIKEHDSLLGIPFFTMSNVDYNHSPLMKTISINVVPNDSTISLTPLSDENVHNSTTVPYGTEISYNISKAKYMGIGDSFKLLMDEEIDIILKKKVRFILKTQPLAETIILKTKDNNNCFDYIEVDENGIEKVVGKYIDVVDGDIIQYSILKDKYVSINDSIIAVGDIEKDDYFEQHLTLTLVPLYTITISPTPEDSNVVLTCENYEQNGNSITVPRNFYIYFTVSKDGYRVINGRHRAIKDETIPVTLMDNTYTVTIIPNLLPNDGGDATVQIESNRSMGEQIDNSLMVNGNDGDIITKVIYTVSKDGYETVSNEINGITGNMTIEVPLRKICNVKFEITPSDATYDIKNNGVVTELNNMSLDVLYGDTISYDLKRVGYDNITGYKVIYEDTIIKINMNDREYFVLETDDTMYFANEKTKIAFVKE